MFRGRWPLWGKWVSLCFVPTAASIWNCWPAEPGVTFHHIANNISRLSDTSMNSGNYAAEHQMGRVMLIMWDSHRPTALSGFNAAPENQQSVWPVHCGRLIMCDWVKSVKAANLKVSQGENAKPLSTSFQRVDDSWRKGSDYKIQYSICYT